MLSPPSPPILHSFPSVDSLIPAVADFIVKAQKDAIEKKGRFTLAISGGSLPKMLRGLIGRSDVKWDKWQVYYVDERVVPLDHPDSNHRLCMEEIFSKVPIPPSHIYSIDASLLDDLEELTDAYESLLIEQFARKDSARFPIFDLILLGMGADGHVASLYPNHHLLNEDERWVVCIEDSPEPPPTRVTLTLPVINHAARVAFVAIGEVKQEALRITLDEPGKGHPGSRVSPKTPGQVYWFVDDAMSAKTQYPRTPFKA